MNWIQIFFKDGKIMMWIRYGLDLTRITDKMSGCGIDDLK